MGNSKNKRYRGNFTDTLFSTKSDDRSARFEIYFSSTTGKLSYKNSDNQIIILESAGINSVTGSLVDNTDPSNPKINMTVFKQPAIEDDDGSDTMLKVNEILATLRIAGIIEE